MNSKRSYRSSKEIRSLVGIVSIVLIIVGCMVMTVVYSKFSIGDKSKSYHKILSSNKTYFLNHVSRLRMFKGSILNKLGNTGVETKTNNINYYQINTSDSNSTNTNTNTNSSTNINIYSNDENKSEQSDYNDHDVKQNSHDSASNKLHIVGNTNFKHGHGRGNDGHGKTSTNIEIETIVNDFGNISRYLVPDNVVSLTIVGFAKTGTSSLMQNLKQFWDLQYWGIDKLYNTENQFWFRNCFPKKNDDTKQWNRENKNKNKNYNGKRTTNDETMFVDYYFNSKKKDHKTSLSRQDVWGSHEWALWIDKFVDGTNDRDINKPSSIGYLAKVTQSYQDSCNIQTYFNAWHAPNHLQVLFAFCFLFFFNLVFFFFFHLYLHER